MWPPRKDIFRSVHYIIKNSRDQQALLVGFTFEREEAANKEDEKAAADNENECFSGN
jgi:hypothetical protein